MTFHLNEEADVTVTIVFAQLLRSSRYGPFLIVRKLSADLVP